MTFGWLPLELGFTVTGALIAVSDFRMRKFNVACILPALLGALVFYWGETILFIYVSVTFSTALLVFMLLGMSLTLKTFTRRDPVSGEEVKNKFAAGDYLTLVVFSFWPTMMIVSITMGLLIGVLGTGPMVKGRRIFPELWNRGVRVVPLAGLMGLIAVLFSITSAF